MNIFFYSPMHDDHEAVPSGDVFLAQNFIKAFEKLGHNVVRPCFLKTFSAFPPGAEALENLEAAAQKTITVFLQTLVKPDVFVTYHVYHKSPDLIGPKVAAHFGVPYVIIEPSHALKQAYGPYAFGYSQALEAFQKAARLITLSSNDTHGLHMAPFVDRQKIIQLEPFIDETLWPAQVRPTKEEGPLRFLTVAMMREGDKEHSYRFLKEALVTIALEDWTLTIVGDGPKRPELETLFAEFGVRVIFLGAQDQQSLANLYQSADLFLWPGLREAIGLVYLEAALYGVPALAMESPSAKDIIDHEKTGYLAHSFEHYCGFLKHAVDNKKALSDIGLAAQKRFYEKFSFKNALQKLKTILDDAF